MRRLLACLRIILRYPRDVLALAREHERWGRGGRGEKP